jgi:tetratricopeptide (TPR) repeat protein
LAIEISGRKKTGPGVSIDDLIGLEPIKRELRKIEAMLWLNQHRRSEDLSELRLQSFHFSFRGNPGTGKTTVARLIGDIFHRYGILRVGDVVEVDRAKLIGPNPGETEIKARKAIKSALDGVLFVDEAYTLLGSGDSSDPGMRALEVILKGMEDYRDVLIVIFAGYPSEMDSLFEAVTGLKSRVPFHLEFPDYSPRELLDIILFMAANERLELSDEASRKFLMIMEDRIGKQDFSNAREVRNILDQAKARLSRRLQSRRKVSQWDMKVLTAVDFEDEGSQTLLSLEAARKEMFRAPSDAGSRSAYARACVDAGLWSDAASALETVEKDLSPEFRALFGRSLYTIGERKRSWDAFSMMGPSPFGAFYKGLAALWSGDPAGSSAMLAEASLLEPDNPDILFALSAARFFGADFRGSTDSFHAGIEMAGTRLPPAVLRDLPWDNLPWPSSAAPLRGAMYFAYGYAERSRLLFTEALIATGDDSALEPAEAVVMECIDLIPDDPAAHRMMSLIHQSSGRSREAAASLEISLELEPRNTDDWRRLANLLEELEQTERAEEIFRDILEEDRTGAAGIRLAMAAENRGDTQEAHDLFRKAWDGGVCGEERTLCAMKLAIYAATAGRFGESLRFFGEAGSVANDPAGSFWLARSLIEEEKWQEAEGLLMTPFEDGTIGIPRIYWLGRIFLARRDFFNVRNLEFKDPQNPYLRLVKGVAEALSGDSRSVETLSGQPSAGMGSDALSLLCSARAAMKDWEEVRRLGRMAQKSEYGPFLWERQARRSREEAGYLASIADAHLGDWGAAREGFRKSASSLRHPGPVFALGVSLVALGKIDEAKVIQTQLKASSSTLSKKLEELIAQNSGIRKMLADPVDPGILVLFATI